MHQPINTHVARSLQADRLRARRMAGERHPARPERPPNAVRARAARAAARVAARLDAEAARRAVA